MRIIVCGGRRYADWGRVWDALSAVHRKYGVDVVIHGGATGADQFAAYWGEQNKREVISYPADWDAHGRSAGPMRNIKMLAESKPDAVVAFPGGRGTADMIRIAREAGVPIWEVDK